MRGLHIYRYALKLFLKDYKSMAITLLFPLILTWIFVSVFTGLIDSPTLEARILVKSSQEGTLTSQYRTFLEGVSSSTMRLEFVSKESQADLLAIVDEENQSITLEKIKGSDTTIQSILKLSRMFSDQMYLAQLEREPLNLRAEQIPVKTPDLEYIVRRITSTMLIFVAMLGGQYAINQMQSHRMAKGRRISISPVKPVARIMGEYWASVTIIFIELIILLIAFEVLFKVGYRQYGMQMLLLVVTLSVTCAGLGSLIGAWIQDREAADGLLSMLVTLFCIASGGLMPNMPELAVAKFSPVSWITGDLEKMFEGMGMNPLCQTMGIMVGITVCLMTLVWLKLRKEALE